MTDTVLETLAREAEPLLGNVSWELRMMNGIEIAPGWFVVANNSTGQSKVVLLHLETGFIFKHYYHVAQKFSESGKYLGDVTIDGVVYPVRLPEYYIIGDVQVQEFIDGEHHSCGSSWCEHAEAVGRVTGYGDPHTGNWMVFNGEVVLFDFD